MNRRSFLAAIGIGAVEVCILTRPFSAVSPVSAAIDHDAANPIWLKRFHGKSTSTLIRSRKFRNFIESQFAGIGAPFHGNFPMWAPVWSYMNCPSRTPVTIHHHRYVVASGCMEHFAPCRGMVWIDAKGGNTSPLVVLSFMNILGSARELWITSNKSLAGLPPSELPHHLTMTIGRWLRERRPIRSDGGYLTRLVIYDQCPQEVIPLPSAWGVKPYRCDAKLVAQSQHHSLSIEAVAHP
jgi:hypothetical protein